MLTSFQCQRHNMQEHLCIFLFSLEVTYQHACMTTGTINSLWAILLNCCHPGPIYQWFNLRTIRQFPCFQNKSLDGSCSFTRLLFFVDLWYILCRPTIYTPILLTSCLHRTKEKKERTSFFYLSICICVQSSDKLTVQVFFSTFQDEAV